MANPVYSAAQTTVGTSPTIIATPGTASICLVSNGAAAIALGGPNVTLATGFGMAASALNLPVPVAAGQQTPLYAICGTSSVVSVLYVT